MAQAPDLADAFKRCWRIVRMDTWPDKFLDIAEPAHITFDGEDHGEVAFVSVKGWLDVRYVRLDGEPCAEFSWEGKDKKRRVCGRGWAALGTGGRLVGEIFIHKGDSSGFVADPG